MKNERIFFYILGCVMFSIGAKFFINSNMGVDPLDSFVIGLANLIHTKIGTASAIIAISFLAIWSAWNKRRPILTPFITMTGVGYLIDLWNYLVPKPEVGSYNLMFLGFFICAYASSLIIMSGIGIRTMDLVAVTMVDKLRMQFFISKGILEISLLALGILLSGPYGIGTILFLFFVGPFIQPLMMMNQRLFGMNNFGLGANASIV